MRSARYCSDGMSNALDDCTGAMAALFTMPIRMYARGLASAFESSRGRGSQCCDPCPPPCPPTQCEPSCDPCASSCNPCEAACGCGDPCCGGCGRGSARLEEGTEVETKNGFVGVVVHLDDCHVTIKSESSTFKITRASICKILGKPLKVGDIVKTKTGHIGTITGFSPHGGVVISSAGTPQEFARKAICEVVKAAPVAPVIPGVPVAPVIR